MITTSPSISIISKALLTFQGAVDGVGKDRVNPAFKSRYATLESVRDTAVPELQKAGVFYLQSPGAIVEGNIGMTTRLIHAESGEWIEGAMDIPLGKKDPQGAGSAITYACRYHLMAMLGLPAVDDDAETAVDRSNKHDVKTEPGPAKRLSKAASRDIHKEINEAFREAQTEQELVAVATQNAARLASIDEGFEKELREVFKSFRNDLRTANNGPTGKTPNESLDAMSD